MIDGFGGAGGIAQFNRDLLTAWSDLDCVERVDVLPRFSSPPGYSLPAKVFSHPPVANPWFYALRTVAYALRRGPWDAVFCGHLHMIPVATAAARLAGLPVWLQIHGVEAWGTRAGLIRRGAEQADVVTAVSRYTRRRFLAWADVEGHRVPVLPNTVGEQFGVGVDRACAKQTLGVAGKRVLLSVSRLERSERYKGHDRIIRCLPRIREALGEFIYLIAGDGDLRAELDEQASREGVADIVRFLGHVENRDLPMLYRAADVFAMPSTGEGFGIVYLESMACGTPVIAGSADGARDPLQDGHLGLLSTDETLASDIVQLLNSAPRADELGPGESQLRANARGYFGRDVFTQLVRRTTERLVRQVRAESPAAV
jgi:phosphatidylinositol alpha-1,6-mannosyltransferase